MACKALAVVGLFVALIIAGCASPTPTPEPTAAPSPTPTAEPTPTTPPPTATPTPTPRPTATSTPTPEPTATPTPTPRPTATPRPRPTATPTATPRPTATPTPAATPTPTPIPATPTPTPRPPEYTAGLGYASADGLEDGDAEIYAGAFADAKALGLGNADARAYASGFVYHSATAAINSFSEEEDQTALADYAAAFETAVTGDSPLPLPDALGRASEAARLLNGWWPFSSAADPPETRFAETYALALAQTDATGVAAHGYASNYAGYVYTGTSVDDATNLADAFARGYERSRSDAVGKRLDYAVAYRQGYGQAVWRAEPEQAYIEEYQVHAWAAAYADTYGRGLSRARNSGWDDPSYAARNYARLFAITKVELGFSDHDAHANTDAYFRGFNYATERGLTGDAHDSYTFDYYDVYFDKKEILSWPEDRAHIYALTYADVILAGREDQDAATYATAYEEAYTSQKEQGATDEDAHLYAAAFADAKLGS